MITVHYTKPVRDDKASLDRLAPVMAIARVAAASIRRRVKDRGITVTPPDPFSTTATAGPKKAPRYYLSPAYAEKAGLGNQTRWKSSAEMHKALGTPPGSADVTGGMWSGQRVRNYGTDSAVIEFSGSSLGSASTRTAITQKVAGSYNVTVGIDGKVSAKQKREYARDEGGKVKYRRKPKLVTNATKAASVFRHSRIGLLQTTEAEDRALWAAWATQAGIQVRAALGLTPDPQVRSGDPQLYDAMMREMR